MSFLIKPLTGQDTESLLSESPESVAQSLSEETSECSLLVGGDLIGDQPPDFIQFSEVLAAHVLKIKNIVRKLFRNQYFRRPQKKLSNKIGDRGD